MTRALLVIGHGRDGSLGHRLAERLEAGLRERGAFVQKHDLLADGFDPVLRLREGQRFAEEVSAREDPLVARYQEELRKAHVLVVVHPVWWFGPPALLKGWVDRVLAHGVALDGTTDPPAGLLEGRRALVVSTFGAGRAVDRLWTGRLVARFWTRAVFRSVGLRPLPPLALYEANRLTPERLARFEARLDRALDALVADPPPTS